MGYKFCMDTLNVDTGYTSSLKRTFFVPVRYISDGDIKNIRI